MEDTGHCRVCIASEYEVADDFIHILRGAGTREDLKFLKSLHSIVKVAFGPLPEPMPND